VARCSHEYTFKVFFCQCLPDPWGAENCRLIHGSRPVQVRFVGPFFSSSRGVFGLTKIDSIDDGKDALVATKVPDGDGISHFSNSLISLILYLLRIREERIKKRAFRMNPDIVPHGPCLSIFHLSFFRIVLFHSSQYAFRHWHHHARYRSRTCRARPH
jgi:hypothetical protein